MQHPIGFLELPLLMNISMTEYHAVCRLTAAGPFVLERDGSSDSCVLSRVCLAGCSQPALASVFFSFLF